jgi:hypothetical protein
MPNRYSAATSAKSALEIAETKKPGGSEEVCGVAQTNALSNKRTRFSADEITRAKKRSRDLFANQAGVTVRYWCEWGRFAE